RRRTNRRRQPHYSRLAASYLLTSNRAKRDWNRALLIMLYRSTTNNEDILLMSNEAPAQLIPSGARDRMRAPAHPIFAEQILSPIFEFNCRNFFAPLLAAHRAWLTMLVECGIVKREPAKAIFKG